MKNKSKFIKELVITLIIASLLSTFVAFILAFTMANLGAVAEAIVYANTVGATLWGLIVGYKLNTLLREHR